MTAATLEKAAAQSPRPFVGIAFKLASVVAFVAMGAFIKLAGDVPVGQIIFYRSFYAMIPVAILLAYRRELSTAFRTTRPVGHVVRGVIGVIGMGLGFVALVRLPLPESITLNYATPLVSVVFAAVFLGEVVRMYRWSAVVIGLCGVVIIAWPNLTLFGSPGGMSSNQAVGVIAALSATLVYATVALIIRRLVQTESSGTIVMWFSLTCTVAALLTWPFGWADLTSWQVAFLILAGLFGGIGQITMTECYRHADIAIIAPFEYTSMIFGVAVGYWLFGDVPTAHMLAGGAIVISTGIFIIWRERQLGLERQKAKKVTPPQ